MAGFARLCCKSKVVFDGLLFVADHLPTASGTQPFFDLATDSRLRDCDLVKLRVRDVYSGDRVAARAVVMQQKTQCPVQFEITATSLIDIQKIALYLQRKMKGDFEILWHKYVLWHKSATTPLQPIVLYNKKNGDTGSIPVPPTNENSVFSIAS